VKERPILFNGPMVKAILESRKTMTRRVVEPQPYMAPARGLMSSGWSFRSKKPFIEMDGWLEADEFAGSLAKSFPCPYGQPGDRLWVRETVFEEGDPMTSKFYNPPRYCYRATFEGSTEPFVDDGDGCAEINKDGTIRSPWCPSIHMPRRASRILLEVTAVRVERVQDISEEDAKAEGAPEIEFGSMKQFPTSLIGLGGNIANKSYRYGFYELWDSINAKRGFGWDVNPWVWVVSYKRIEGQQ
jgi:hypothetical protein